MGDYELLQRYAGSGSNEAFAELVRRHLDLVYSAARRQVRSAQLAEEVTQAVFFDLSRCARKLKPTQPLAAWLFLVTRRTAIDTLRRENRQRARDQIAVEIADMKTCPSSWTQIESLLDEAIISLNEKDRSTVLLRFFENKSLREIGEAIGVSDDAAQKRVSRAVEELRAFFGRHGVKVSAATLTMDLPVQAVQSAPSILSGALVAGTPLLTATTGHVSNLLFMATLKKVGLWAVAVLAVGVGIYEARQIWVQQNTIDSLEQRLSSEEAAYRKLKQMHDEVAAELASARSLATAGDPDIEAALDAWLGRVAAIRRWLEKMPEKRIPQMALLTEDDWLDAAKNANVETELGAREAIMTLRRNALDRFSEPMRKAFGRYRKDVGKKLPESALTLAPYFDPAIDPALLSNFELIEMPVALIDVSGETPRTLLGNKVVDDIYDIRVGFTVEGSSMMQSLRPSYDVIVSAVREYRKANAGQSPLNVVQLSPYLKKPVQAEYLAQQLRDVEKLK